MKRIRRLFCLTLIVVLLCAATVGASAAYYNKNVTGTNFEKNYSDHYYSNAVYCSYTVGGLLTDGRANTGISVSNDAIGYAYTKFHGLNGIVVESENMNHNGQNWILSGSAVGQSTKYAKRVEHYCVRTVSGATDHWTVEYS